MSDTYYRRQKGEMVRPRKIKKKSDRFPIHKKPHKKSLRQRILRDWKKLGKDIELLD